MNTDNAVSVGIIRIENIECARDLKLDIGLKRIFEEMLHLNPLS